MICNALRISLDIHQVSHYNVARCKANQFITERVLVQEKNAMSLSDLRVTESVQTMTFVRRAADVVSARGRVFV